MINSIMEGIASAIYAEFGDGYKIYAESIRQGLTEPCFFVQCIDRSSNLFLGTYEGQRRYRTENDFCVQYFPKDTINPRIEIHSVCETLEACLEWITADGDLIRGTQIHYEIADGILSFFISYNMFVRTTVDETSMEEIEVKQSVESEGE